VLNRLSAFFRHPIGRILSVAVGLGAVAFLVYKSGAQDVWNAVTRAPLLFVVVFLLEVAQAAIESYAVIALFGPDRAKIPLREAVRSSMFCYSLVGVLPLGRATGEAARAAILSRYTGFPAAGAAAARMQAITLIGNAFISIPCALGTWLLTGPSWLFLGIVIHFVVTGVVGFGIILAGRHSRIGDRLKKYFRGAEQWGSALDGELQSSDRLKGPTVWIFVSRVIRLFQRAALLAAVGCAFGPLVSLGSESINLVAGMVGDIIPMRLGVNEAIYAIGAKSMSMSMSDAVAMALLNHVAQLLCVGIGFLSPLLATQEQRDAERAAAP
jgi:hypothetical protein